MTATTGAGLRAECLERRRAAVRAAMQAADLELLIAYGSGRHTFLAMNPAWYLTGFRQMGRHMALLLPLAGEPTLVMTPPWDLPRARERATVADVVATTDDAFLDTVAERLRQRGLLGQRTAVAAGGQQPRALGEAWAALLGAAPASGDPLVSDIAKIRDEWSLDCVRRAVAIAEQGYQRLLETARPGMREHEVVGELDVYMRELGADDNFQLMCASQHNRAVHAPTDRVLERGDVLLGEITPAVEGEFIQICRTAVLGGPTPLQLEKFALLDAGLGAGMRAATPGTPVTDVVAAINKPLDDAGYGRYTKPPFMRTRGHAMAMGSMEPEIAPHSDHVLEANEVFVMHPNQYIPETGYLMCGEPVIVAADGAHALTSRLGTLDAIAWGSTPP
ncbi:MAG TPA: Xaa-Pro peptidase family protein [Chloroflexota bacterium]|jgi:Xaa-Pro aminopeptidase